MDMDEKNNILDVVLVEGVEHRKKVVKRVMGDTEKGGINGKT